MILLITVIFLVGYLLIALEHPLKIDKAGTALVTGIVLWVVYMAIAVDIVPVTYPHQFAAFLAENPAIASEPLMTQVFDFVQEVQIIAALGEIAEILFFLVGAMTIVELIDVHGGFNIITNRITTRDKRRLMWIMGLITFFMSATLDNLTTAIVMITLLRKLVANYKERWLFAGVIIIAANSGGAWSPIGDITTIMLWVRGNVTTGALVPALFLPSFISFALPTFIASRWLHGNVTPAPIIHATVRKGVIHTCDVTSKERLSILILGVACLVSVPIFKTVTHLPPFMGILLALGIMWIYTEIMYKRKNCLPETVKARVPYVLHKIDTATILFFLGILLAVSALQASGILANVSFWLDDKIHNVYAINTLIGGLSSVVDNVPLVAGSIGTYPVADAATAAASVDPAYAMAFVQDGLFWLLLAYCAGVGGSMLIIGSAAGVVVMGLEKMTFGWYLRKISLLAMAGYLSGIAVFILQQWLFA